MNATGLSVTMAPSVNWHTLRGRANGAGAYDALGPGLQAVPVGHIANFNLQAPLSSMRIVRD